MFQAQPDPDAASYPLATLQKQVGNATANRPQTQQSNLDLFHLYSHQVQGGSNKEREGWPGSVTQAGTRSHNGLPGHRKSGSARRTFSLCPSAVRPKFMRERRLLVPAHKSMSNAGLRPKTPVACYVRNYPAKGTESLCMERE
jgi:hypothetical protein